MTDLSQSASPDMADYRPSDREEKLGPPPWKPDDPKVIAWEAAHGHDVRLRCYVEFGCRVLAARADRIEEAAREAVDALNFYETPLGHVHVLDALRRLRTVLNG